MSDWKRGEGKYANKESKFGINFREDHPDLFKLLSNERGYLEPGKSIQAKMDGKLFQLTAKEIARKSDGKKFILVERKETSELGEDSEEQIAARIPDRVTELTPGRFDPQRIADRYAERQARIDKAHQENLEVQRRIATATENLAETMTKILEEIRHIAGAVDQDGDLHVYKLHKDGTADKQA